MFKLLQLITATLSKVTLYLALSYPAMRETCYCAAYQRSAICDEFGESDGCSVLIG